MEFHLGEMVMDGRLRICFFAASAGVLACLPVTASAQSAPPKGDLDEVIVTARRRAENVQDVPTAVTAVLPEQLRKAQITTQNDLQYSVPSLNTLGRVSHQGATYAIRGLAGSFFGQPSVGTYFAEVSSPTSTTGYDPSGGSSLYDLASVQVLKGPQGTLFGRSSTAGAVLVTPRGASVDALSGHLDLTEGTQGRQEITGAINVPILPGILGVRAAVNKNHLDGYTHVIGAGQDLDETNTKGYRLTVEFRPTSWLRNTTLFDVFHVNEAPAAFFITATSTADLAILNLPANTTTFNAACNQAITAGLSPNLAACVSQRLQTLSNIKSALNTEVARVSRGGGELRRIYLGPGEQEFERSTAKVFVNTTEITLPTVGAFETSLKNIFGYQHSTGMGCQTQNNLHIAVYDTCRGAGSDATNNQSGNNPVVNTGPGNNFYTNETQFNGRYGADKLVWVIGYYSQNAPVTNDTAGVGQITRSFSGVTTPNLGYVATSPFLLGGKTVQHAVYGQATLSLGFLVDGLHFTAGGRRTSDRSILASAAGVVNTATGLITPSPTAPLAATAAKGTGYNFSLDWRINPNALVYATTRKGYVPGGLNTAQNATNLASFSPTFGPENIKDYEVGAKTDFTIYDMRGRLNVAAYYENYTNIQRAFSGINAVGSSVQYTVNSAAAVLKGFEAEGFIQPTESLRITANYALNLAKYKRFLGADPLSIAPAGTARVEQLYGRNIPHLEDAITQKAFALINVRYDWENVMGNPNLRVGAFIKNLTDKTYSTSGLLTLNTTGVAIKIFGEPRTVGVELGYKFGE